MVKARTICSNCGKEFWSKADKLGIPEDDLCRRCLNMARIRDVAFLHGKGKDTEEIEMVIRLSIFGLNRKVRRDRERFLRKNERFSRIYAPKKPIERGIN